MLIHDFIIALREIKVVAWVALNAERLWKSV